MPDTQPPIPPEAVEAAARAAYDRARAKVTSLPRWDEQTEGVKDMWREDAEAAIRAALPHLPQHVSRSRDEVIEAAFERICVEQPLSSITRADVGMWVDLLEPMLGPQHVRPSVEDVARLFNPGAFDEVPGVIATVVQDQRTEAIRAARLVLDLFSSQPTVAEVWERALCEVAEEMEAEYERRTFKAGAYGQMKIRAALRMGAGMIRARIARGETKGDNRG